MYAVVEDDTYGELNPRNLVGAPFPLRVTPAPTTPSVMPTSTAPASLDRTYTGDFGAHFVGAASRCRLKRHLDRLEVSEP